MTDPESSYSESTRRRERSYVKMTENAGGAPAVPAPSCFPGLGGRTDL